MARPTTEQCATYRTRLEEAELALHNLRTGSATVVVRMGEKSVEYKPASVEDLASYVGFLTSKVAECDGKCRASGRMIGVIPL